MNPPTLPQYDVRKADAGQLRLLGIFHFVVAGFGLLGLGILFLHSLIMRSLTENPQAWNMPRNTPGFPPAMMSILGVIYVVGAVFIVVSMVANILSGYFILQRKYRVFSLVIAGLNCLHFPFGTALGIFTFIVLLRPSVEESYNNASPTNNPQDYHS